MTAYAVRRMTLAACMGLALAAAASGCSRQTEPPPAQPAQGQGAEPKGVTRTLVEEASGYRAAKQGQLMKEKIRDISAEHDAQMSAILDEKDPPSGDTAK